LIEGSAAFFTAISMIVIPYFSFDVIFYLFAVECILAGLVLFPLFLRDLKVMRNPPVTNLNEDYLSEN